MAGLIPAREEETARLTGARGDFVGSLGRRVEALRASLKAVEQTPGDAALRNGLLRRVHALSSAAKVLGFASVAEALTEAEKRLRKSEFGDVARSLDLLPSLLLGVPPSLRSPPDVRADRVSTTWPLSVLIFGEAGLVDAMQAIPDTHVECERTVDLSRAREQARAFGPDLAIIDADLNGASELVEAFAKDPLVEPVPLVVIGHFANPEAASLYIALGAARVLSKPVSTEALQRTVIELRALAAEPRGVREPLGDLSVEGLAERIASEVRRGLLEAAEPSSRGTSVGFGDGADVMAAVWGAVARVRELVTLRSSGAVRFDSSGPEGAVPFAAWTSEERRAGDRGASGSEGRAGDSVTLHGRRIVVADDDPAVVWFMSGLLKALGVEVLEAHDGARALALTYDAWPDLVVSDVLMPKLDGFSLCHEIKRDVAVRDVPVILLSWKEDLLQRVRELGATADGYLRKEAAASTVAERLREVLRPRARVEQRIASGGDARGRLDGLTPRLILELASRGERDVRVGVRDAVYLYEVQVRRGRLCAATRSAADGRFERGEAVLAALLGVSAGRFVVEADSSSCRVDFEGVASEILKGPIERARRALASISAGALVGVTRVHIAAAAMEGYLACTPEPARDLLEKVMAGASPRELITSGSVAPRLLEAVLSDVARRGAISEIERIGGEPAPTTGSPSPPPAAVELPRPSTQPRPMEKAPQPSVAPLAREPATEDTGWFSTENEANLPVGAALPKQVIRPAERVSERAVAFNRDVTPASERLWEKLTEGVFSAPATLEGVGPPEVALSTGELAAATDAALGCTAEVESNPLSAPDLDALASALTEGSPHPPPVPVPAATVTQVMPVVVLPEAVSDVAPTLNPAASRAAPSERVEQAAPSVVPSRVSARVSAVRPASLAVPKAPAPASSTSVLRFLLVAALAFGAAYFLISNYRSQGELSPPAEPPAPPPAR